MTSELTHFDPSGRVRMVDVSSKEETARVAIARGRVAMQPATLTLVREGRARKGDVLAVAQVAGVLAAKRTAELIPLCHPLPLASVELDFALGDAAIEIEATVKTTSRTGVEMEALTAVTVAALTIYDMLKAADRTMQIEGVRLVYKSGGRSGTFTLGDRLSAPPPESATP
ncbi:MAG: cyclic pyranopterin monophosphate synthase accessory protein [Dehalococcoidia bacterium]|nr:MAG: cyclic pyranopterin monophosphate synthase accessory protein [Dehalococcoidia bacterium]